MRTESRGFSWITRAWERSLVGYEQQLVLVVAHVKTPNLLHNGKRYAQSALLQVVMRYLTNEEIHMKNQKTLKDYMRKDQRDALGDLPTTHANCIEKTKVARPGKTARDRAKRGA